LSERKNLANQKKEMGPMKNILILHGWTYTTDKWEGFTDLIGRSGSTAILLNVPGLTSETDRVWTLDDYVEWLNVLVSKEKEKPVLVGHSNGGRIALAFASKYPGKLSYLVLVDAAGIYHNELPIRIKRSVFKHLATLGKKFTSSSLLRRLLYKLARESDYKNASPNMRETMANLISVDLTPELEKITTPTLIIWGELDNLTPLTDGKLMHKLIRNSELYTIKGAGHSPQYTHPKEVTKKLEEVLQF
jgi:pimeloyl-ACP methyl ester carboxylesterase